MVSWERKTPPLSLTSTSGLQARRMDAVGTQFRVLLEALDCIHSFKIGLESALVPGGRFILKTRKLLFGPASRVV
jgi:hypothetical protein